MSAKLVQNSYGKSAVRLTKVVRSGARHELIELSADVQLRGDFAESYTAGDNAKIVATDSMKNTVYVLAKELAFDCIEVFAAALAEHFVRTYAQVESAEVKIEQTGWTRIDVGGRPHDHAFTAAGSDRRVCRATHARAGGPTLSGGVAGLLVLKTTGSEFWGFVADRYRTLKDAHDRIFATSVDATWEYAGAVGDFNVGYEAVRAALLTTFAAHQSLAVQQTLLQMGEAALAANKAIASIALTMPNQHRIPFNLQPFGLENANDIFVPTDEPFGLISGTVRREGDSE